MAQKSKLTTENDESIQEFTIKDIKVRTGMVKVSDGKSCPVLMRLHLTVDTLRLQKEQLCYNELKNDENEEFNTPNENELRIVSIRREEGTGLGLSIKGGAEHNLPVMISHIEKGQAADKTGKLFVGDAIIKVNGATIFHCTHDEAVNILRDAGDLIMLTVKHYKAATPFLSKAENGTKLESSDFEKEKETDNIIENGVSSLSKNMKSLNKKWVDVICVPLTMAYVTRYVQGSDKLRPNGFEVLSNDIRSGIIYCSSSTILSQWLKYISDNIAALLQLEIRMYNGCHGAAERVEYMGWVNEAIPIKQNSWHTYTPLFFAIKASEAYLFKNPPLKIEDWQDCESVYKLYTSTLRVVKESECVDERQHCFLFNTSGQRAKYLAVETRQELLKLELAWNSALCSAVRRLGTMRFGVVVGKPCKAAELIIDWEKGYSLYDNRIKDYLWEYRYSQLKGSSDDGKSKLKLHFRDDQTKSIETKEIETTSLDAVLYCMLSFMHAKVSAVDTNSH